MPDIRPVTEQFAVAPQLLPEDVPALAGRFSLIVNNRPDGEEAGQPCGETVAEAAKAAGIAYVAIPISGAPTPAEISALRQALDGAEGSVLAYCRSGMRSIVTWAVAEATAGRPVAELRAHGLQAGYDLGPPLQMLLRPA